MKSPIWMEDLWNFSYISRPASHYCVLEEGKFIVSLVGCLMACKLSLLARSWWDTWYTWSFGSLITSCWLPNHDKQSASRFLVPGMYLMVKLYGRDLIKMHCILGVAWLRLLDSISSRGFWSVSNMKWQPYRKWWNFSTAHATASDSISISYIPSLHFCESFACKVNGFVFLEEASS